MNFKIRHETEDDHQEVESLTREAFWNLYMPGCDEHYLTHIMRSHPDFLPEMSFVAEGGGRILGNIMYTRSRIVAADDANEAGVETLTFGPVCVHPDRQGQGVGPALIRHTIELARQANESLIIILGHPRNYVKYGFQNTRDFDIADSDGRYPFGMLVLDLTPDGFPKTRKWKFVLSDLFNVDSAAAEEFDRRFPEKAKEFQPSQVEFGMAVRAYLD